MGWQSNTAKPDGWVDGWCISGSRTGRVAKASLWRVREAKRKQTRERDKTCIDMLNCKVAGMEKQMKALQVSLVGSLVP